MKDALWGGGVERRPVGTRSKFWGGRTRAREGGSRGCGSGAQAPRTEQISQLASVGWGGTHRSWPGGQGGKPRALVAGEGYGGPQGRSKFRNLRRIFDVSNTYKIRKMIFFEGYPVRGGRTRAREGGSRGFGSGGVGGRGTGLRDGANFATCVVFF